MTHPCHIIAVDAPFAFQQNQVTDFVKGWATSQGGAWWHHLPTLWMVALPPHITARHIREAVQRVLPSAKHVVLTLKTPPEWDGFGLNDSHEGMMKYLAQPNGGPPALNP